MTATLTIGLALSVLKALFEGAHGRGGQVACESPVARTDAEPVDGVPRRAMSALRSRAATDPAPAVVAAASDGQAPGILSSLEAVAWRLLNRGQYQTAQRIILAGEGEPRRLATEGLDLAHMLVSAGRRVLLVDWSGANRVIASRLGISIDAGFGDAATGDVPLDSIVHVTRITGLHYIGMGSQLEAFQGAQAVEAGERARALLDALDPSYEDIVLVASGKEARILLRLLDGGFDAAVEVAHATRAGEASPVEFLGLKVSGLEVLRYRLGSAATRASARAIRHRVGEAEAARA